MGKFETAKKWSEETTKEASKLLKRKKTLSADRKLKEIVKEQKRFTDQAETQMKNSVKEDEEELRMLGDEETRGKQLESQGKATLEGPARRKKRPRARKSAPKPARKNARSKRPSKISNGPNG